jgi:hypothetical protein
MSISAQVGQSILSLLSCRLFKSSEEKNAAGEKRARGREADSKIFSYSDKIPNLPEVCAGVPLPPSSSHICTHTQQAKIQQPNDDGL